MSPCVLLVEDNPLNRQLARDILEYRGHKVVEAGSVEEARKCLGECKPNIILLDIQIPGGGGEVVLQEVRRRPDLRDLPVVAVTAFAMRGDEERLLRLGFDGYLSKPINVRQFGAAVEAFIK